MYGLVNNGIRQLIIDGHGEDRWRTICKMAGVPDEECESLSAYDDSHTFALVEAASDALKLPADEILESFGNYWVRFSKATAMGKLIDQGGETLLDRIQGLDELHERVQLTMPHLNPPSFELEETADGNHRLHYMSNRHGLAPMVIGLLHGMAKECGVSIVMSQVETRADGADHDVFLLQIGAATVSPT